MQIAKRSLLTCYYCNHMITLMKEYRIGVVGLGYVGLPLALGFAKKFPSVIGFDINSSKVDAIKQGIDPTSEGLETQIKLSSLKVSSKIEDLKESNFYIVGVPTPVDEYKNPDLRPVKGASELVGKVLKKGDIVVYESTVYPGVTEDICAPILESVSGLKCGEDFFIGYSPERINPGDKAHTLETIVKVVAGQNGNILDIIASVYGVVVSAGVFRATSIKVAEAAKVIENTQRDINIALMNELALIFDRMGIRTKDVLEAAGTKWNFLKFSPGLVGGHCIGVDPYYLTTKAKTLGYHSEVILAGRKINDDMGRYVAQRIVKLLIQKGIQPKGAQVGVFGITFKENVADVRNSRVPDIITELNEFGCSVKVCDPNVSSEEVGREYGINLTDKELLKDLDVAVLAVCHTVLLEDGIKGFIKTLKPNGIFIDIKSVYHPEDLPQEITYWSL